MISRIGFPASLFTLGSAIAAGSVVTAQVPLRLFVDASLTTGADNGSSWTNAFKGALGLQHALAAIPAATSAEVWVANGTYRPGLASEGRGIHFALRDGVALYGGFAGGETALEQRNPVANPAVLSGDLASNDVFTPVGELPNWTNAGENALHVVRATNVGASARLDGFTIRRGSADGSFGLETGRGGGLLLSNASASIAACVIRECHAGGGAGAYALGGAPRFDGCTFDSNDAQSFGAGAWIDTAADITFDHCAFRNNVGSRGVGMFVGPFTSQTSIGATRAQLVDCRVEANKGLISAPAGIGAYVHASRLYAQRTLFLDNRSGGGGGAVFVDRGEAELRTCDFVRNNGAFDGGGAFYVLGDTLASSLRVIDSRFVGNNGVAACVDGALELTNCTLFRNDDAFGSFVKWPIVFTSDQGSAHLRNCIVKSHAPVGFSGLAGQFHVFGGAITIDDSCVEGWDGSLPGAHDFALDPQFTNASGADGLAGTLDDDLSLLASSPCIDRSNHAWRTLVSDADLAGKPRYVNRVDVADLGAGCAPFADLGALERGPNGPWTDLHGGIAGGACVPHLAVSGSLASGASMVAQAIDAPPTTPGFLVLGLQALQIPLLGATLVPEPLYVRAWATNAAGLASFAFSWPSDILAGSTVYAQSWHFDASAAQGWAASNAQLGVTP